MRVNYLLTAAAFLGCQGVPPDAEVDRTQQMVVQVTPGASAEVPGFRLTEGSTAVPLTALVTDRTFPDGTVRRRNGRMRFISRLDDYFTLARIHRAEGEEVHPFMGTAEEHGEVVKNLFLAAGLPDDQIASVTTGATMRGGSPVDRSRSGQDELEAFTTVITRTIGDIPVTGSFAMGQIDDNGRVRMQQAFWPPVPERVVAEAHNLRNRTDFAQEVGRKRPELVERVADGRVSIHIGSIARRPNPRAVYWVKGSSANDPEIRLTPSGDLDLESVR